MYSICKCNEKAEKSVIENNELLHSSLIHPYGGLKSDTLII